MLKNELEILFHHPLFSGLSEQCKEVLSDGVEYERFEKDEYIFNEGDMCESLFLCVKGTIIIEKKRMGRDMINRIVFDKELFYLEGAITWNRSTKSAKVVSNESIVLKIPRSSIKKIINKDASFSQKFLIETMDNLKNIERRLESFLFRDAKSRIIDFIKYNAEKSGIKVGYETLIKHEFTQQNIAEYTGTTRQTVTTILKELSRKNIISFQRKRILVRNLSEL